MNHRTLSALKVALLCLLVTGLIAACGGSSNGTKTNGSNGSTVRPSTGQPNPSNKAAGSVNPTPPALTQAAQPNPAPSAVGPVNPTNPATTQPTNTRVKALVDDKSLNVNL